MLHSTNDSRIDMEFNGHFYMTFELISNEIFGTSDFTITVSANGFTIILNPASVRLGPGQVQTINVNGTIGTTAIGGGTTHSITVTASNGCIQLRATRQVTVKPLVRQSLYLCR